MTKTEEAIMFLAEKLNVTNEVKQMLCLHRYTEQIDSETCKCRNCGVVLSIEEFKQFLEHNYGTLLMLDGSRIYRARPV